MNSGGDIQPYGPQSVASASEEDLLRHPHLLPHPTHLAPLGESCLLLTSAHFFQVFDNEEFDCRTPSEWINMGLEPGSQDRKPVPGKALLPTDDILGHGEQGRHGWGAGSWSVPSLSGKQPNH